MGVHAPLYVLPEAISIPGPAQPTVRRLQENSHGAIRLMPGVSQMALDFTKAQIARDRGISRTIDHTGPAWFEKALADFVRFVCERGEATVEAWRFDWLTRGMPAPADHHSYGALAITAAKRGHIVNTGRYVKASSEKTHRHVIPYWKAA